jgi:glycosyltransferase involved in cell wall biosynthesis
MTKVSVVIPTYNRASLIAESIQSVLDQTFADFEIIVIDDGSSDNTREVVGNFKDPRIKYIRQDNHGVCEAMNNGIKASCGEYIICLGSDDVLLQDAVAKGVQVLDNYPEAAFSYGKTYTMDQNGRVNRLRKINNRQSGIRKGTVEIAEYLIYGNRFPAPTVMARRNCLFEVGLFDPSFSSGSEDIDLWLRLARRYSVVYIAEPLAKYRITANSITANRKMAEEEESKTRIVEGILNDAELGHLFSAERPKAYFNLHLRLARRAYDSGETVVARKHLFAALKKHPIGIFKGKWAYWFAKTWVPLSFVRFVRRVRRYLNTTVGRKYRQSRK